MHPFKKLIELPLNAAIGADELQAYRDFYALPDGAHQMYPLQSGGERVMMQCFQPAQATSTAMMCHGYYDHVGLYGHLIRYLLQRNVTVVTFDQPGHGLSTGQPAHIDSFDEYVATLRGVEAFVRDQLGLGSPQHWVGQSMGGAVLMEHFAQSQTVPTGDLVLFAPLLRPYAWWLNRWVFAAARHTIQAKKRVLTRNADNPEFLSFLAQDPLQADVLPVAWVQAMVDWSTRFATYPPSKIAAKIIQGQMDRTIDWQHNVARLGEMYPQAQWLMLPTGRHHLVNESALLRKQMFDWLDERAFGIEHNAVEDGNG